jgi:hypothetical protein
LPDTLADITLLLHAAASGERSDLDALMDAIYHDLRRLAMARMNEERWDHTLLATTLAHEAHVQQIHQLKTQLHDRLHFVAVASSIIRRIRVGQAGPKRGKARGNDDRTSRPGCGGTRSGTCRLNPEKLYFGSVGRGVLKGAPRPALSVSGVTRLNKVRA